MNPQPRLRGIVVAIFILAAIGIGAFGAFYLRAERKEIQHEAFNLLKAIGELKARQISSWRQDCIADIRAQSEADFVARTVSDFLAHPDSGSLRQELLHWLALVKTGDRYASAALCDAHGVPLLKVPATSGSSPAVEKELVEALIATRQVVLTDLHRGGDSPAIHMNLLFPIFARPSNSGRQTGHTDPAPLLAMVVLQIDPHQFLYPLVKSWPTSSRTAETLLVRQDGNDVLYLNELRYRSNSALSLRLPLASSNRLPAAKAVLGYIGQTQGTDYRGMPVVADVRPVPDSPWHVISKIDGPEIYARLQEEAWLTLALTSVLIIAVCLVAWVVRKHSQTVFARRELAAERQRLVLANRVEQLMKCANDIIFLTDQNGNILEANDRAVETYGYSRAELERMKLSDLSAPEAHGAAPANANAPAQRQALCETLHRRKDGSTLPVEKSSRFVEIADMRYGMCIVRDITERKRGEIAAAERARTLSLSANVSIALTCGGELPEMLKRCTEAVVKNLDAAFARVWTLNETEQVLELQASAGLYTDLQGPHARVRLGQSNTGMIAQERRPYFTNSLLGDPRVSDQAWAKREGMVAFAGFPLVVDRRLVGVLAVYSRRPLADATLQALAAVADAIALGIDRKNAETALRQSEHRFRTLLDNIPVGVFVQTEGNFSYVNQCTVRFLNAKSPAQLIHSPVLDRLHPDCREQARERIRIINEEHRAVAVAQLKWVRIDGAVIDAEVGAVPLLYEGKQGALVFFQDVTERKRLEEELRQAQKIEAIGQLAGGVAHDFNNILAATLMQLELMQMYPGLDPEIRRDLDQLQSHAKRAANLTRQLLLFGRRSVMQARRLDLNEVVENLLKMLRRLIGENIELRWECQPNLPLVNADAGMLDQVITNLVVNARDALPDGGQITLSTTKLELAAEKIPADAPAKTGAFVRLSVADTGCGMDAATLERIFEPFFTTKEAGKGTGLGLATVYGIVKQHQGWVSVQSEVGKGSTFQIFLPADTQALAGASAGTRDTPIRRGSECILLVEDDAAIRQTTSTLLRRWGYRVIEAANGPDAIELWEQHGGEIDLLLTDMVMPGGVSGIKLAEVLRARRPDLAVVLCSGYSLELLQKGTTVMDGLQFLPKPCSPLELAAVIRKCLDRA